MVTGTLLGFHHHSVKAYFAFVAAGTAAARDSAPCLFEEHLSQGKDFAVLLRTKFYRPSLPQDLLVRPRLIDQLNQALRHPLILISAPAGYGKSVLASSFLQTCPLPSAWLSLDEQDADLRLFLDYVLTALDALFAGSLRHTQSLLAGTSLPPVAIIADSLVNELAELESEFILVLEDVHLLRTADIYGFLSALLRHPLPGFHLLLLTRQDPPLELGRLRAYDQLGEIRGRDLRFTAGEMAAFMDHAVAIRLRNETLAVLAERTEGWAAGLRLVALMLRNGGDADQQIAQLGAENRYVVDYLVSQVLARIPPELEDFLLKTSILDMLCGSLCDAVMDAGDATARGQANLQWLEELNLFTMCLDEERLWYRYHHLFQGLLRSRLERTLNVGAIAALHLRASAWYANHGHIDEALRHALAGGDTPGAVQLVAQHRHHLVNTEQRPRLERWLTVFPEATVAQHPDLLLAKVWSNRTGRSDTQTGLARLEQVQTLVDRLTSEPERARQFQGEIDALRCIGKTFAANDPQGVIMLATRALETLPREWYLARATAWLHLAVAQHMCGQLELAKTLLTIGQQEDMAASNAAYVRIAGASAFIHWMNADLARLLQTAQHIVGVTQSANLVESHNWGHCFLATATYQRNELAAAELHANVVLEQRYGCDPVSVAHSACVLAAIHQAHGSPEAARVTLEQARDYLREMRSEALLLLVQAFGAELAARQGDLDTAGRWAATVGPLIPLGVMAFFYAPQLTLPRVLLAMNTPASRQQAAASLSRLHAFVTETHNTRFLIDVLALEALLHAAEGNEPAALQTLEQALLLAQPGGFIRVFVDLGPAIAGLLKQLPRQNPAAEYVDRILRAFAATATGALPSAQLRRLPAAPTNLVEPLTRRELEILELMAQWLSARDIAQRLVISEATVKRHIANIFQKLAVNKRGEAVTTAIALGLLPARP